MRQFFLLGALLLLSGDQTKMFAQVAGVQAPGTPIFDCAGDTATINRLSAGLPVQEEALKRGEATLDAWRIDGMKDSADAREKWTLAAVKFLSSYAKYIANSSETLIAHEEGLKSHGIPVDVARRVKVLESVKKISDLSETLAGAGESYEAGHAFGSSVFVQKSAKDLIAQIEETRKLFVDSGIAEEMGAKLSEAMWGPIGEVGFKALVSGSDALMASYESIYDAIKADEAERNLEVLRSQYRRIQDRIYELKQEVSEGCANPQPKQNVTTDQTPPPSSPQPSPVQSNVQSKTEQTKARPKGSRHTGAWILTGALVGGGVLGAAEASSLFKQKNCGSAPNICSIFDPNYHACLVNYQQQLATYCSCSGFSSGHDLGGGNTCP